MIVCLYPGCGTILRQENKVEKFCSVHQRRLVQYDIVYKKGKFHLGRPLLMRIGVKRLDRLL